MNKYMETFINQMEIGYILRLPTTSNSIESKNSLFSAIKKIKKCFGSVKSMEEFY